MSIETETLYEHYTILTRDSTRVMTISAVVLAATLAALLAVFVLAKPSGAADTTVTVDPITVGADEVDANFSTSRSSIIVTNNGDADVVIGGASTTITGLNLSDFFLIDPITGLPTSLGTDLTIGAGETVELQVGFKASAEGVRNAVLELRNTANELLQSVNLTGTGTPTDPLAQPGAQGCTKVGTPGDDTLTGTSGKDIICGLCGNDKIKPLGGKDVTRAGSGEDRVTDKSGKRDKLLGQSGGDRLNARDGNRDLLKGGGGKDRCVKNKGDRVRSC